MTQVKFAKALGTTPQSWQVYEYGTSIPGGKVLESLSRMGFDVNWILTGEGEMKRGDIQQQNQPVQQSEFITPTVECFELLKMILSVIDTIESEYSSNLSYNFKTENLIFTYITFISDMFDVNLDTNASHIKNFIGLLNFYTISYDIPLNKLPKASFDRLLKSFKDMSRDDNLEFKFQKSKSGLLNIEQVQNTDKDDMKCEVVLNRVEGPKREGRGKGSCGV